jgi:hypothetical protein
MAAGQERTIMMTRWRQLGYRAAEVSLRARCLVSLAVLFFSLSTACVPAFKPPAESILRIRSDGNAKDEKVFGIRDVVWGRQDGQTCIVGCGWGHQEHQWVTQLLYMGFWPVGGVAAPVPEMEERWLYVSRNDEKRGEPVQWRVELLLGPYYGGTEESPTPSATQVSRQLRFEDKTLFVGRTDRCGRDWLGNMRLRLDGLQMVSEKDSAHTIRVSGTVVARPASGEILSQIHGSYRLLPVVEHLEAFLESSRLVEYAEVRLDPLRPGSRAETAGPSRDSATRLSLWVHTARERPGAGDDVHALILDALRQHGLVANAVELKQDRGMPGYWTANMWIEP